MGRLGVLRGMPSDSDAFWEVFAGVSIEDMERGVKHALKTRAWYPAPVELMQDIEVSRPRQTWVPPKPVDTDVARVVSIPNPFGGKGITVTVYRDWNYYCEKCSDGGFTSMWCHAGKGVPPPKDWMDVMRCGRGDHEDFYPHEWMQRCSCWDSNPALIKKRESLAAQAASRGQKTRGDAA